ncbi:hypothetical protein NCAS_0A02210 [Naumovozyma castellii]|uniref:UDENN FLCN/SMCR8-type domain-containing protein n=1 Tax=Naumovozyma castellii TaxID=27288 RepID=G0V5P1_NAUCA|nr:hypothetical protein NCAS_0A02210 [Naumovozyma castellii CBS 4309]CCC66779.1 hypothetical protein NCAS_0A02210 [Naumovozyma castellii CBS 4309]
MSSILISLAHFCDKHGPQVILVTQTSDKGTLGDELLLPDYPIDSYCESCLLHFPDNETTIRSMRSILHERPYITTQYSAVRYQLLNAIIRRSFSEETMVYDSLPNVFHDNVSGVNLVMGFKLYDENARGNERRYCLILTIDDKDEMSSTKILSNNWNFITGGFLKMINYIKDSHAKELERKTTSDTDKNGFTPFMGNYLRGNKSKIARNLIELTNDKNIFIKIHKWNTYLLDALLPRYNEADV